MANLLRRRSVNVVRSRVSGVGVWVWLHRPDEFHPFWEFRLSLPMLTVKVTW